jgi:hypothetical protein
MAYKWSVGQGEQGDIVYSSDLDQDTKIDFEEDQIKFIVDATTNLMVTTGSITIGAASTDIVQVTGTMEIRGKVGVSEGSVVPSALLHISQSADSGGDTSLFRVDAFSQTNPAIDIKDNGTEAYVGINTSAGTNALTVDAHSAGALAVRATNGHVGTTQDNYGLKIGTAAKTLVHDGTDFVFDDSLKSNYYITTTGTQDLGSGTSSTLSISAGVIILDADSITGVGDPGSQFHTLSIPNGTTNGQHLIIIVNTTFGAGDNIMINPNGNSNLGGVTTALGSMAGKTNAHYVWYSNAWFEM